MSKQNRRISPSSLEAIATVAPIRRNQLPSPTRIIESTDRNGNKFQIYLDRDLYLSALERRLESEPSMSSRVTLNNVKKTKTAGPYAYTYFPEHSVLFDSLLPFWILSIKVRRLSRRTAYNAAYIFRHLAEYLNNSGAQLHNISDISQQFIITFRKDVRSGRHFSNIKPRGRWNAYMELAALLKQYFRETTAVETFAIPTIGACPSENRESYSDYVLWQILAGAFADIENTVAGYRSYKAMKATYVGKDIYCLENIAYAYKHYRVNSGRGAVLSRILHNRHGMTYQQFKTEYSIDDLALTGEDVLDFTNKRIQYWYLDSFYDAYPFKGSKITAYQPLAATAKDVDSEFANKKCFELKHLIASKYPTLDQIYPFFVIFLIMTGSNAEVLCSWRWFKSTRVSEIEIGCQDDMLDDKYSVWTGIKNRGVRPVEHEVIFDKTETNGLWSLLGFLKEFLKPAFTLGKSPYFWSGINNRFLVSTFDDPHLRDWSNAFLRRHEICDENGVRLVQLAHSRFRPTFVSRLAMAGMSFDDIKSAVQHGSVDTTMKFYGTTREQRSMRQQIIYATQERLLQSARDFQGEIHQQPKDGDHCTQGLIAACADNHHPDFDGSDISVDRACTEYDMCLGCKQSRIFKEHLPRIAMRIIQYEKARGRMLLQDWDMAYGVKYATAHDALSRWTDKEEVRNAWRDAKSGQIKLPEIM